MGTARSKSSLFLLKKEKKNFHIVFQRCFTILYSTNSILAGYANQKSNRSGYFTFLLTFNVGSHFNCRHFDRCVADLIGVLNCISLIKNQVDLCCFESALVMHGFKVSQGLFSKFIHRIGAPHFWIFRSNISTGFFFFCYFCWYLLYFLPLLIYFSLLQWA